MNSVEVAGYKIKTSASFLYANNKLAGGKSFKNTVYNHIKKG